MESDACVSRKEKVSVEKEESTMNDQQKDLGTLGQENALKGKRNQTAGWFQKVVGKMTGNRERQARGAIQEAGGKMQSKMGGVEQKADQAIEHD
jgi:uncharacterized protein YjbJ (UPF0337 family)